MTKDTDALTGKAMQKANATEDGDDEDDNEAMRKPNATEDEDDEDDKHQNDAQDRDVHRFCSIDVRCE